MHIKFRNALLHLFTKKQFLRLCFTNAFTAEAKDKQLIILGETPKNFTKKQTGKSADYRS